MTHDNRYKYLFSSKEIVIDFLKHFTLKNLDQRIELESLEMLDTNYSMRKGDQVWRANFKNNQTVYFLLMLEFQSSVDHTMPVRIATYTGELYQKLKHTIDFKKEGCLPFVLPIVIYNGDSPWNAQINFELLYNISDEFADLKKYQLHQEFLLIDISSLDYNQYDDSLFKYLFELESGCFVDQSVIDILKKIAILSYSEEAMNLISFFVKNAIKTSDQKLFKKIENTGNIMTIAKTFEREFKTLQQKSIQQGLEQGLVQGLEQGLVQGLEQGLVQGLEKGFIQGELSKSIETAKNALSLGLTDSQVMLITGLTQEELEKIKLEK